MVWLPPFVMHSVLPPGIEGFRNVTDDDIAVHGRTLRDHLAGYRA
jgi:hypothetical protein